MKKILFIISTIFISQYASAQELPYTFYTEDETFEELNNEISLNNGEVWGENFSAPIDLNFDFKVGDQIFSKISVTASGVEFLEHEFARLFIFFTPFGGDLIEDKGTTESLSPISYIEDMIDGNKVLKIEWKNAGFKQSFKGVIKPGDFVTYQVWLIENLNLIKIMFGPSVSTPETYGPSSSAQGPFLKLIINSTSIATYGQAASPSYTFENCSYPCYASIVGTPPENLSYNFELQDIIDSNENLFENDVVIYPTPVNGDKVTIELDQRIDFSGFNLYIINANGSVIDQKMIKNEEQLTLDLERFNSGLYFIRITNKKEEQVYIQKIIKS